MRLNLVVEATIAVACICAPRKIDRSAVRGSTRFVKPISQLSSDLARHIRTVWHSKDVPESLFAASRVVRI